MAVQLLVLCHKRRPPSVNADQALTARKKGLPIQGWPASPRNVLCCFGAKAIDQDKISLVAKYQKQIRANPRSSITHFRIAELYFQQHKYQSAANEFREALSEDLQPPWVEVWSRVSLGKVFDISGQRDRAINEYHIAKLTNDNTRGALDDAETYLAIPYSQK
jgi:tetratricopeptide (TPR) repeat protein